MSKSKLASIVFLNFILFLSFSITAHAALLVVNPDGKIIPQVLGDSTIEVTKVAQNLNSDSQIALTNDNGKVELNGIDVSSYKETLVELEARANSNDIKISGANGSFYIEENGIKALTSFPITVDSAKKELSVLTPSGSRIINILPNEAIEALIRAKFINKVDNNQINLVEDSNGELEYQIDGSKNINLFNLANIDAKISAKVSATTGELIKIEEPTWLKIFGFVWQ